ncbi:MAG: hypothetical protein DMD34_14975 [Gemmatimonadetes bacterium]|nr:MAG: hypothetical protein DMD34_14975 [Gemmatimonadota bacterium]
MKFRLCLYLYPYLYLYLPPHREVCVSASTCRHRVSEMRAPWCARETARSCMSRTHSLTT